MSPPISKPTGLTPEYAAQYQDLSIVQAYRHREPYPEETFKILAEVARAKTPRVADLGCGTGDLTLGLSRFAGHVDAVDFSPAMLKEARHRADEIENIEWIEAIVEAAALAGEYDLIVAGDSFHWLDWQVAFDRIKGWLKPNACFAVIEREYVDKHWWTADLQRIINTFSTNRNYQKYDLIEELGKTGSFQISGDRWTEPVKFRQSAEDLIEAFHSRNGFSRERMGATRAAEFDAATHAALERFSRNGKLDLAVTARVTWGRPL